ncbi:MAG: hypothetical protein E6J90_41420 [Deltaproteobacteria bacterium]|nr:MAG: hypothetical protein E6J90_41420 [Deltaproteobacteria bacterium]TMQ20055.1 MAG: hypothetical protein E6J91_04665 [Deltaproteobacteria bacterium]
MIAFEDLLVTMIGDLPLAGGDLVVSAVELELPIESRFDAHGRLEASWPRGRFGTGFDPPLGEVTLRLVVEEDGA